MFWFILVCDLLVPLTMLISGRIMWKHPPRIINGITGYRTTRSMKNQDTWNFAHEHCGKLWWQVGWLTLLPSALAHIPFYRADEDALGIFCIVLTAIQVIVLIGSIIPTERALKRTFDENGIRRNA